MSVLQGEADAAVWVCDWALPPAQQGLMILGTPFGRHAYVQQRLEAKREEHDCLLQRIPLVQGLSGMVVAALLCFAVCQLPVSFLASAAGRHALQPFMRRPT